MYESKPLYSRYKINSYFRKEKHRFQISGNLEREIVYKSPKTGNLGLRYKPFNRTLNF